MRMTPLFILGLMAILLVSTVSALQVFGICLWDCKTIHLINYYDFDNNLNDSAVTGYDGNNYLNGTFTSFSQDSILGSSIYFDNSKHGLSSQLNHFLEADIPFTINLWVKPLKSGFGTMVSMGDISDDGRIIALTVSDPRPSPQHYFFDTWDIWIPTKTQFILGEWDFLTFIRNETHLCIYKNAQFEDCTIASIMDTTPSKIMVGTRHNFPEQYFYGYIDELSIYDGVISKDLMEGLYNNKLGCNPIKDENDCLGSNNTNIQPTIKNISRNRASIKTENNIFQIWAKLESQGYSPVDGLYHIITKIKSKKKARVLDYALISPVPINTIVSQGYTEKTISELKLEYPSFDWNSISQYGNYVYISYDEVMKSNKAYDKEIVFDIDKSYLPVKYTLCFFDRENNYAFCLDPTITNSRTWSTTADFTNDTVVSNISTSNNQITISLDSVWDNLVAHYPFEDGNETFDNYDLTTNNGGVTYGSTTAKHGNSADFGGDDTKYLETGVNPPFSGEVDRTFAGWVYYEGGANQAWVSISDSQVNREHFDLLVIGNGNMYIDSWSGGAQDGAPTANGWSFIAVTFNSTGTNTICIINNASTKTCYSNAEMNTDTAHLRFGARLTDNSSDLVGHLDEWSMFNRTLENAEIDRMRDENLFYPSYLTTGIYSDRQGWSPQSGNAFTNISVVTQAVAGGTVEFRYNNTNASLDTTTWTELTVNGTNNLNFSLSADDSLFYQFRLSGSSSETPVITSYTINEATPAGAGTLTVSWTDPVTNDNHTQYNLKTYTAQINCTGGSCGNVNVTLDPILQINSSNTSDVVIDAMFDEDSTRDGTENLLIVDVLDDTGEFSILGFNLSKAGFPYNAILNNATLCLYPDTLVSPEFTTSDETMQVYYDNNQTWQEADIDAWCSNGALCDEILEHFTDLSRTYAGVEGSVEWNCISELHADVQDAIDNNNDRVSWILELITGDASNQYLYNSREDGNQNETPYLLLDYSVGGDKGIIPVGTGSPFHTTNSSNPSNLCGSMGDGDTCNIGFDVNATGNTGLTYNFYWIVESDDAEVSGVNSSILNMTIVAAAAGDTCTYTSGDWNIDCSDNCNINTEYDLSGNDIYITGTGLTIFQQNPINYGILHTQGTDSSNICRVRFI